MDPGLPMNAEALPVAAGARGWSDPPQSGFWSAAATA
jgi:hypothetical protein